MNRLHVTIFLFIFINRAIVGMADTPNETNLDIDQSTNLSQSQTSYGSTSESNLSLATTTINQRAFPIGAQPQFPNALPGYGGPWKENWNIISTDLYKLFETFWPVRKAKEDQKGGGKLKSLYWEIPYIGSILSESAGVNVIFETNEETTLPPSAVPIGVVIVKGGEKTVVWHLVARAVLEASKRGATWLNVELYNYVPRMESSSFGLGLATTGAAINSAGDLSGVTGGGTGWARAKAGPITEPFVHAVAYVIDSTLKAALEKNQTKEEVAPASIAKIDAQSETIETERPKITPKKKPEAFKMTARIHPDTEKKVVYVSLKNTTKKRMYVTPSYFRLETQDGKTHSFSLDTYTNPSRFWGKRLEPGEEASGFLVFKTDGLAKRLVYDDMSQRASSSWNFN